MLVNSLKQKIDNFSELLGKAKSVEKDSCKISLYPYGVGEGKQSLIFFDIHNHNQR